MGGSEIAAVFDIADFIGEVFYPCVAIGAILPAGAAVLASLLNVAIQSLGMLVDD